MDLAKDGTQRGGRRPRAGCKPQPLAEKLQEGKKAVRIELPPVTPLAGAELDEPEELTGEEMPNPSDYLSARQRNGKPLGADEIYRETWQWLKERRCERLVNPRLLESYAQAFARFIQCEEAVSQYGLLGKHPTTGKPIPSPFINIGISYMNQAIRQWNEIFQIVKENCTTEYSGANPQDDLMERLLRARKG